MKNNDIYNNFIIKYPMLKECENEIFEAFDIICNCVRNGNTIMICGNGGSCSDAEHIAGELLKGFIRKRPLPIDIKNKLLEIDSENGKYLADKLQVGIRAISLTSHPGLSTAVINDLGGDLVYAQQVNAYAKKGDVLICLSTSGNARNVELACKVAKVYGVQVIGMTGKEGGKLFNNSDCCIRVPSNITFEIQEYHLPIYHLLCAAVECEFFAE